MRTLFLTMVLATLGMLLATPPVWADDPNEAGVAKRYRALVPALIQALKDQDKEVVQAAAAALGNIGSDALPALVRSLQSNDKTLRGHAALALGKMGPRGQEAIPALLKVLQDPDVEVRRQVARALAAILAEHAYSYVIPLRPPGAAPDSHPPAP